MKVRHNTKLLEEAVAHVVRRASIPSLKAEAEARERQDHATARRRLATGAAIAVAAVGLGLGAYLGLFNSWIDRSRPSVLPSQAESPALRPSPAPTPGPTSPQAGAAAFPPSNGGGRPVPQRPEIVTTDYEKFNRRTVSLNGREWDVVAGHHFSSENDPSWDSAWCYTRPDVNGLAVQVDLAARISPTARPNAPLASTATLTTAGLDDALALALATKCAWLDERVFSVGDFAPPPGRANPFEQGPSKIRLSGRTLFYTGAIGEGFLANLKSRAQAFDELEIDSYGGLLKEGMAAGLWLRGSGKRVRIRRDCLSACVIVLAGGTARTADAAARIGVHRFYSDSQSDPNTAMEGAQQMSSEIIRYLSDLNIDIALFHAMAEYPPTT